jgi:hypothetical protein
MRAVRELAMGHAGDRGLLLHAAAGAVAHRVVVLAGPTAAGKTTLLLHLLRSGVARYVANNRVRVSLGEDPPRARGMPTIVTIRPRTRQKSRDGQSLDASGPEGGPSLELTRRRFGAPPSDYRVSDQVWRSGAMAPTPPTSAAGGRQDMAGRPPAQRQ